MNILQLDGTIVAPTNSKAWGSGLLQWLEFKKLVGITIQGNGIIDGRGSVWWQDTPLDDPIDDEAKLMIPQNNTVSENPPVILTLFCPNTLPLTFIPLIFSNDYALADKQLTLLEHAQHQANCKDLPSIVRIPESFP